MSCFTMQFSFLLLFGFTWYGVILQDSSATMVASETGISSDENKVNLDTDEFLFLGNEIPNKTGYFEYLLNVALKSEPQQKSSDDDNKVEHSTTNSTEEQILGEQLKNEIEKNVIQSITSDSLGENATLSSCSTQQAILDQIENTDSVTESVNSSTQEENVSPQSSNDSNEKMMIPQEMATQNVIESITNISPQVTLSPESLPSTVSTSNSCKPTDWLITPNSRDDFSDNNYSSTTVSSTKCSRRKPFYVTFFSDTIKTILTPIMESLDQSNVTISSGEQLGETSINQSQESLETEISTSIDASSSEKLEENDELPMTILATILSNFDSSHLPSSQKELSHSDLLGKSSIYDALVPGSMRFMREFPSKYAFTPEDFCMSGTANSRVRKNSNKPVSIIVEDSPKVPSVISDSKIFSGFPSCAPKCNKPILISESTSKARNTYQDIFLSGQNPFFPKSKQPISVTEPTSGISISEQSDIPVTHQDHECSASATNKTLQGVGKPTSLGNTEYSKNMEKPFIHADDAEICTDPKESDIRHNFREPMHFCHHTTVQEPVEPCHVYYASMKTSSPSSSSSSSSSSESSESSSSESSSSESSESSSSESSESSESSSSESDESSSSSESRRSHKIKNRKYSLRINSKKSDSYLLKEKSSG